MRRPVAMVGMVAAALLAPFAVAPVCGAQFTHPTLGYSLTYDHPWMCNTEGVEESGAAGPVFLTVPREKIMHGGVLPEGAARISVQLSPPYNHNFPENTDEYERLYEMARSEYGDHITRIRRPDGTVRVDFTETWEAGTFKKTWIGQRRGGRLFVFMLEYYATDPKGVSYERDLDAIVWSIAVVAATPSRTAPRPKP